LVMLPEDNISNEKTAGNFTDENEACDSFDRIITDSDLFTVYKEVTGKMIFNRFYKKEIINPRIDRILTPKIKLINAGWDNGIIGVEIKRSGKKVGRPIAQSMDYLDSAWFITPANLAVLLSHVCLYPCDQLYNNVGSICSQNHIGQIILHYNKLEIFSGQNRLLSYNFENKELVIRTNKNGLTTGSR
jgi:hypothetical protein